MTQHSRTKPRTTAIDVAADASAALAHLLDNRFANMDAGEVRAILEDAYPSDLWTDEKNVWTGEQLLDIFEISHFAPPYVHVIRKADAVRGTVLFVDAPRFYFAFQPVKER